MKRLFEKIQKLTIAALMTIVAMVSCTPEQTPEQTKYVIIPDEMEVYLESVATSEPVVVAVFATDNEWQLQQDDWSMEWCTVATTFDAEGAKAIAISATENTSEESREAYLTLYHENSSTTMTVVQIGSEDEEATRIECDSVVCVGKGMGEMEPVIEANGDFEVVIPSEADWLSWENGVFIYSQSYEKMPRTAEVVLKSSYAEKKISFVQYGTVEVMLPTTEFVVPNKDGEVKIPYEIYALDAEASIVLDANYWSGVVDSDEEGVFVVGYIQNESDTERNVDFTVTVGTTKVTGVITQLPIQEYEEVGEDAQKDDMLIGIESVEAVSEYSTARGGLTKLYDGNVKSYWATKTNENPDEVWVTYNFAADKKLTQIDYMHYIPTETVNWGQWGEIEVYLTYNGVEELLGKYDFKQAKTPSTIYFEEPLSVEGLEKMTVKILTAAPFSETITKVASGNEFGLYQYNPENFPVLDYFTDWSCCELRSDVTWEQIQEIKDPLYRNVASQMFNGDYSRFRTYLAKPYLHPDRDAAIFLNAPKTLLDGVTGMYVRKAYEPLVIYLEEDYGEDIYLRVIDWENDEGNAGRVIGHELANADYRLHKGRNFINPGIRGLIYILWHTDNYDKLPPIKMNFMTGVVNGYFNAETDDPKDFYEIMMQAGVKEEPHFDIITDNVVMTFTKLNYRKFSFGNDPNNYERAMRTIQIFDTITRIQQIIQGFDKYAALGRERVYHNRAPFYGAYGDCYGGAGAYATVYGMKNMAQDILDPDRMWPQNVEPEKLNNGWVGCCWGLAHELGHNNQTNHFGWRGLGEVSNNLMGAITQTTFFGEGHTTMRYNNHFNLSMADIVTRWVVDPDGTERHLTHCESVNTPKYGQKRAGGDPNHQPMVDPTTQLMPFWQLYLYYHRALGKEDFYPDFYELCRLDKPILFQDWFLPRGMESSEQNAKAMLEYMVKISTAAGEDLSGFCNDWHIPGINNRMLCSHYGQSIITTTQEDIDKRVEICSQFPKPEMNPLYINDLNVDLYRYRTPLTAGTYSVDDNGYFNMNGDWSGVAAWALVDPATERVMGIYQGVDKQIKYRYYTSIYEAYDPEVHGYRGQGCPEDSPYLTYNNGYQRYMIIGEGVKRPDLELYGVDVWGTYHKGTRVE
ncbi:MAG: hypothetical protein E7128_05235 [Rikenellaceae bacterium]|nr:hypothetical protein [Rikenellaceae bacterium]